MRKVVLAGAVRTPIGKFGGALANVPAALLGETVIKESLNRSGVSADVVSEVIMGHVLQGGLGQGTARQAAVYAGIPYSVPAMAINRICGSGLEAVNTAVAKIIAGDADVIVAGGMENMSAAPYVLDKARWGLRMGAAEMLDMMITDALTDVFYDYHMGVTAENIAEQYGISRGEQDEYAVRSQERAAGAIREGRFEDETIPVEITVKKQKQLCAVDEYPRPDVTAESLAKLKPAFKEGGTVTAGNASGINDGAAAIIVMSEERAKELGVKPMAEIVTYAAAGIDPKIMGIGPVYSTNKALHRAGLTLPDIGLIEANEAFAAQSVAVGKLLGWDPDIVNVNGGAIALGHPVGASGARILVTLLHEMGRRNTEYGLATLCVGGGMGVTTIVKKL